MLHPFKRKLIKFKRILLPTLIVGVFFVAIIILVRFFAPYYNFARENNLSFSLIQSLVFDKKPDLKEYKGRTNVVLLGISGGSHEGGDLTDTIIFTSTDFAKKDVVVVSVPRDVWLPSLKDRINSAYHYGEEKKPGGGLILAKAAIEEVLGQPVQYGLMINFSGFEKVIDLIGGVDIEVEKSFTDKLYPVEGKENDTCGSDKTYACRYETLVFEKGRQHMDGKLALKYVRSRHAEGEEGTDFARGRRQQQVILAVKNKIITQKLWKDFNLMKKLYEVFMQNVATDLNWSEKILLGKFFLTMPEGVVRQLVLDTGDEKQKRKGFLVNPPAWQYKDMWVLTPRSGDFTEIQKYISCQLESPSCEIKP